MQKSFIRELAFEYTDTNERNLTEDDVPVKFQKQEDDYQPRVKKTKVFAPPPKYVPTRPLTSPPEEEPCCPANFWDCCQGPPKNEQQYEVEMCGDCCVCQQGPEPEPKEPVVRKEPKYRLRQHVIRFKQVGRLHFDECSYESRNLEEEQSSSVIE